MKALYAAIMTKFAGSTVSTNVGGRIYQAEAQQGVAYPHIVFMKVTGTNEDTFTERIDDTTIQFSLFSTSEGVTEIGTMYDNLRALLDDATFSVTGYTLVSCRYESSTEIFTEITTPTGTVGLRHWPVDYLMTVRKS